MTHTEGDGTERRSASGASRAAPVFALGFFALVAQTLLFRVFLATFEGNELGIGCFFGSWLVWVALGAVLGRVRSSLHEALTRHFELAVLLYLPAFLIQHAALSNARGLAGVAPFEAFPYVRMMGISFIANAPVSLMTGLLFATACRWWSQRGAIGSRTPVARVYVFEALGAFAGGVAVTALLAWGIAGETVAIGAALLLALATGFACTAAPGTRVTVARLLAFGPAVALAALLVLRVDSAWEGHNSQAAWTRLLPIESYRGAFTTGQGEYLYGEREGQFIVVAYGGTEDALPGGEYGSEVAAFHLAQHPDAHSVLAVGPGCLPICTRLTELPQIKHVAWLHPDPDYPARLLGVLPESYRPDDDRVEVPGVDVRDYVRQTDRRYDLVVLNLPDATTLVLNRYSTREFFGLLKGVLAEGGVVSLRVSGGENYLGGELAYLGASALATLESMFAYVALKPGEESWLMASDGDGLTQSPATLRDRFAAIPSAASLFPPDGILSLYPPDRVSLQMDKYREAMEAAPEGVLLNTDQHPKALLHSLLVALRRAGVKSLSLVLPVASAGGFAMAATLIGLCGLLRLVYRLRGVGRGGASVFDGGFLVFSMGVVGMALSITLMFLFQSRFGSLFLYIGLVSSLFMLGSFVGGMLTAELIGRARRESSILLPFCVVGHVLLVLALVVLSSDVPPSMYAVLFVVCGAFTGAYFPIAAERMRVAGHAAGTSGSTLETLDHLGGALGAVLTGLFLLPVLGSQATLILMVLLVSVNALSLVARNRKAAVEGDWFDKAVQPVGYTMFGVGAFFLVASLVASVVQAGQQGQVFADAARGMAGGLALTEEAFPLAEGGSAEYFSLAPDADDHRSYLFETSALAQGVYGYGGPIDMAVRINEDGVLLDFRVIRSKETPAYLRLLEPWLQSLKRKNLFEQNPFAGVDAVSGATLSSDTVMETLAKAGQSFAIQALGIGPGPQDEADVSRPPIVNRDFVVLALLMVGAIALRYRPNPWLRRCFLLAALLVTGVWLNLQYSTQQMASLLGAELPQFRLTGPFFLAVVVPFLVVLFGNVYCGSVCPFGALQELLGDLRPARHGTDPDKGVWRYGRAVKYALLLLVVVLFAVTRSSDVLVADPLITVFSAARGRTVVVFVGAVLVLCVVYRRFWCRNLCPAGAFLALLNGVTVFRKVLPSTRPAACDLGIRTGAELDCIACDRCRHEKP